MKSLYRWLRVLFTPSCWIQLKPYDAHWDAKLQQLLRTEKFHDVSSSGCYATLGNYRIWVANHPYASFVYEYAGERRPSRATILEAGDVLSKFVIETAYHD